MLNYWLVGRFLEGELTLVCRQLQCLWLDTAILGKDVEDMPPGRPFSESDYMAIVHPK